MFNLCEIQEIASFGGVQKEIGVNKHLATLRAVLEVDDSDFIARCCGTDKCMFKKHSEPPIRAEGPAFLRERPVPREVRSRSWRHYRNLG